MLGLKYTIRDHINPTRGTPLSAAKYGISTGHITPIKDTIGGSWVIESVSETPPLLKHFIWVAVKELNLSYYVRETL